MNRAIRILSVAVALELAYPGSLPWAYGLTSGAVALAVNVAVYVALAYLLPQSRSESERVTALFGIVQQRHQDLPEPGGIPQREYAIAGVSQV